MEKIKQDIKNFFKDLSFEEDTHKYYINNEPVEKSVSILIKDFHLPFDKYGKSLNKAKELGITQEEVLLDWKNKADIAIKQGNQAHLFGELYTFNRTLRPQSQYDIAIMKFWRDLPKYIVPVFTEAQMYHKKKKYAGTADTVLYNLKTEKFIITDYKTTKDLFKNFKGQKMLERFSNLLENSFNKYQIQLSYYQILLEQIPGIEVSSRKIIQLKPDGTYLMYDTEDLTQYLR